MNLIPLRHIISETHLGLGVLFFNDPNTPPADKQEQRELINISGGGTFKDEPGDFNGLLTKWSQVTDIRALNSCWFYGILWAECDDGVADRKSPGSVWNTTWNRRPTEDSSLLSSLLGVHLIVLGGVRFSSHAVTGTEQFLALVLSQLSQLLGSVLELATSFQRSGLGLLGSLLGMGLVVLGGVCLGSHAVAAQELLALVLGQVAQLLGQIPEFTPSLQRSRVGFLEVLSSLLRVGLVILRGVSFGRHSVATQKLLALVLGQVTKLLRQVLEFATGLEGSRLGFLRVLLVVLGGVCFGRHAVAAQQLLALVLGQVTKLLRQVLEFAAGLQRSRLVVFLGVLLGRHAVAGDDVVVVVVETAGLGGVAVAGGGQHRGGEDRSSEGCGHGESELHGEGGKGGKRLLKYGYS
ncbi:hypothetical protein PG996_007641 [Apiospora saccharicola]|uniref:Uncharacterized protein n=1 Tax=Apiospora saccharicola TaxID=335842 RepID=A0ABR1VBE9_9PEZI